jgi:hypothetical protein
MHGFFYTAGPTEDFRERQTPGRSLAGWMQTRVHLHMTIVVCHFFDSFSATG